MVDLGNSPPRRCNRVRPESVFFGVVTVSDPVSIHLKKLNIWELRGLQLVVHMELGAEGRPLGVEFVGAGVGDVTSADGSLRSAEITDEITPEGGWHGVQEHGDCGEWYLREKRSKN